MSWYQDSVHLAYSADHHEVTVTFERYGLQGELLDRLVMPPVQVEEGGLAAFLLARHREALLRLFDTS